MRRRIEAWSTVQSRSEDGTLASVQRARSARPVVEISDAGAKDLGQRYWREAVRASRGLVHCRQEIGGSRAAPAGTRPGPPELPACRDVRRREPGQLHLPDSRRTAHASGRRHAGPLADRPRGGRAARGGDRVRSTARSRHSASCSGDSMRRSAGATSPDSSPRHIRDGRGAGSDGSGRHGPRLGPRRVRGGGRRLAATRWVAGRGVRTVAADVTDATSVRRSLEGVEVAYYLVHSLGTPNYADVDRQAAETVAREAERAGVSQLVYLGGLGDDRPDLSPHLRSRLETASRSRPAPFR